MRSRASRCECTDFPRAAHTALEFSAAHTSDAIVYALLPALGVPATYYEPFALDLARRARAVVILSDLRGQGSSTARPRGDDFGYREMMELDLPALLAAVEARHPRRRPVVIGHSLGGQLAALYAAHFPARAKGLALVAAGSVHPQAWRPGYERAVATAYMSLIRATAAVLPWYPGRMLGFGHDHPKRLIRDWGHVVATGRYRPEGSTVDYEASCARARLPVLSVGIAGDPLAPAGARAALVDRLAAASKQAVEVPRPPGSSARRAHFAWARKPGDVAAAIAAWSATLD